MMLKPIATWSVNSLFWCGVVLSFMLVFGGVSYLVTNNAWVSVFIGFSLGVVVAGFVKGASN